MKKLKKAALLVLTGAMLAGTAITASAGSIQNGQWCVEPNGYWFKLNYDGSVFLANTWYWIKDSDGVIRCYYFNHDGWLVTNTTVDGETVNDQGQWVVNGAVQTAGEDQSYATHTNLAPAAPSGTTVVVPRNLYKSSSKGDNPTNATFTQGYANSTVNGTSVVNDWANFTMTIANGKTPTVDNSGDGTDFYIESDDSASLYVFYVPIDEYGPGNVSLDAFTASYLADARGYRGGALDQDITLGAYTFKQLTKTVPTPEGNMYDHVYIRQVEGTNYVQIISVETKGHKEDYMSTLSTIARVR